MKFEHQPESDIENPKAEETSRVKVSPVDGENTARKPFAFNLGFKSQIQSVDNYEKVNQSIESRMQEYRHWVKDHLLQIYNNDFDINKIGFFSSPVHEVANKLFPTDKGYITKEHTTCIKIFAKEMISFTESIILKPGFNESQFNNYLHSLYQLYFSRSPDGLEYLKANKLWQMIIFSKINETYGLRDIIDTQGEMALILSWANSEYFESFLQQIKSLDIEDKISVIKQLSTSAIWAQGNESWAMPAYKLIVKLLIDIRKNETNPLVSFIADFQLKRIENKTGILSEFDGGVYFMSAYDNEDEPFPINEEVIDIKEKVNNESADFFRNNTIVPSLENVTYSKVSKDYGSIMSSATFMPFALVETKDIQSSPTEIIDLKSNEVQIINNFIHEIKSGKNMNPDQRSVDIADFLGFLKQRKFDFSTSKFSDRIKEILEQKEELDLVYENIKNNEYLVNKAIEDENHDKSLEVIDYVNTHADSIFVGAIESLKDKWLTYKKENYEDGLFSILQTISSVHDVDYTNKVGISSQAQIVADMFCEVQDFHISNFGSFYDRVNSVNSDLQVKMITKISDVIEAVNKYPIEEFIATLESIIDLDKSQRAVLHLKSYAGIAIDKSINPDGDDFSRLVKILHNPELRNYINNRLSIQIEELALREQVQFLRFLSTADESKYEKLENSLKSDDEAFSLNLLKSFLSIEHGGIETGDKILSLAETLPPEVARDLFEKYSQIVDNSFELQNQLTSYLSQNENKELRDIPNQLLNAFLERSKDLLIALHNPSDTNKVNPEKVQIALEGVILLQRILNDFNNRSEFAWKLEKGTKENALYNITDSTSGYQYQLKLFARPRAQSRGEARMNFELGFDTENPNPILKEHFYNETYSKTQNKVMAGSVLRFGIDRSAYPDAPATVSVDFGRAELDDQQLKRTGDILGNILDTVAEDGHHTTGSFTGWILEEENFAQVVELFQEQVIGQDQRILQ